MKFTFPQQSMILTSARAPIHWADQNSCPISPEQTHSLSVPSYIRAAYGSSRTSEAIRS